MLDGLTAFRASSATSLPAASAVDQQGDLGDRQEQERQPDQGVLQDFLDELDDLAGGFFHRMRRLLWRTTAGGGRAGIRLGEHDRRLAVADRHLTALCRVAKAFDAGKREGDLTVAVLARVEPPGKRLNKRSLQLMNRRDHSFIGVGGRSPLGLCQRRRRRRETSRRSFVAHRWQRCAWRIYLRGRTRACVELL